MLDNDRILSCAEKAARVAYTVLDLDCPYSVALINEPDIGQDALLDAQNNVVELNLLCWNRSRRRAYLRLFPLIS